MSVISSLLAFLFTTIVWFAGKKTISTNSHANQWKNFYTTYNNYRKFYKMYKEKYLRYQNTNTVCYSTFG